MIRRFQPRTLLRAVAAVAVIGALFTVTGEAATATHVTTAAKRDAPTRSPNRTTKRHVVVVPFLKHDLQAKWIPPSMVRVGRAVPAYLALRAPERLHDVTVSLIHSSGVSVAEPIHAPSSVGRAGDPVDVHLRVTQSGSGEVSATITGEEPDGRTTVAQDELYYATAGNVAVTSTTSVASAVLQALAIEKPRFTEAAYEAKQSAVASGSDDRVAAVERSLAEPHGTTNAVTSVFGSVAYLDTNGQPHTSRNVDLVIMDADGSPGGGSQVACTSTDNNGDFNADVSTYRSDGTSRKLYVVVYAESVTPSPVSTDDSCLFNDPTQGVNTASPSPAVASGLNGFTGFKVTNPGGVTYSYSSVAHAATAAPGSLTLPAIFMTNATGAAPGAPALTKSTPLPNDNQTAFDLADAFVTGDQYVSAYLNPAKSPYTLLSVVFPSVPVISPDPKINSPNPEYFQSPSLIDVPQGGQFAWDPLLHEFGHYIAANLHIDQTAGGGHSFGQNNAYLCLTSSPPNASACKGQGLYLAWSEGVATFMSLMMQDQQNVAAMDIPLAGDSVYNDPVTGLKVPLTPTNTDANIHNYGLDYGPGKGEDDELSVVRTLWQIYKDPSLSPLTGAQMLLDFAGLGVSETSTAPAVDLSQAMSNLLAAIGGAPFQSATAPADATTSEPITNEVSCILGGQAVAPVMTEYDSVANPNSPGVYNWSAGGAGNTFPLGAFTVQFWSSDWGTLASSMPYTVNPSGGFTMTQSEWASLLASRDAKGNPITSFNVVVVGANAYAPATGPYRSCAVTLDTQPPSAELDNTGTHGDDNTGSSVAMAANGTNEIVGSPGDCQGYTGGNGCDLSSVAFWSFDATTASWSKTATFGPGQIGLPGCSTAGCQIGAVWLGGDVAMSGDGLTAAATITYDPGYTLSGSSDGVWKLGVATFALEGGQWVSTGEVTALGQDPGVIDTAPVGIGGAVIPTESVALDDAGAELAVGDPSHVNAEPQSTSTNLVTSEGQIDLFYSNGNGDPNGFHSGGVISDPTQDAYPPLSCVADGLPCSTWTDGFALDVAVSGDGDTVVASNEDQHNVQNDSDYILDENVDVFDAQPESEGKYTGVPGAESWQAQGDLTSSDLVTDYRSENGTLYCNGVACAGFDDFATSLELSDITPGAGLAVSEDGSQILVGDPGFENDTGDAYFFSENSSGGYTQSAELQPTETGTDYFGFSVAISPNGETALMGAPYSEDGSSDNGGYAEMFSEEPGGWASDDQGDVVTDPDNATNDLEGFSVSLGDDGEESVIGSPDFGNGPGEAADGDSGTPPVVALSAPDLTTTVTGAQGTTGQSTTLQASVDPVPSTGEVSFAGPDGPLAGCQDVTVDSNGMATCAITLPATSTLDPTTGDDNPANYTASYGGGGDFLDSMSGDFGITVVPALSITTTSLSSVTSGDQILGVSIAASGGLGTYTWAISGTGPDQLPQSVTLNSDGTLTGVAPAAGSYAFTVEVTDTSPSPQMVTQALTLTVTPGVNNLAVAVEPTSTAIYGVGASVTAVVSVTDDSAGPPAGDHLQIAATLEGSAAGVCSATLGGGSPDEVTCQLPSTMAAGDYAVVATFEGSSAQGGDPNYPTTTSDPVALTVQPVPTSTWIGALPAISVGSDATIPVDVTPGSGGTVRPTGDSVTVEAVLQGTGSNNVSCTAKLAGASASVANCDLGIGLVEGTYDLTASYGGDPNYQPSLGTAFLTVLDATTTTASMPAPTETYGTNITFTAKVVTSDGTQPSGTVTFTSGLDAICSTSTFSGTSASCASSAAPVGDDTITASFVSAAGFAASSGTTTLQVSVSAPPAPPGSTASNSASGLTAGTVTASVTGISASGNGVGAITVATYNGTNPTSGALSGGTGVYYDVAIGAGSDFTTVTIVACDLGSGGNGLRWWNGGAWVSFSNVTIDTAGADAGCVTATVYPQVDAAGSPTIEELTGTPIGAVDLATGDFSIGLTPSTQNLGESSSVSYTVNVGSTGGFDEPVTLSATALPAGVTGATFYPDTVTPDGTSILTLSSSSTFPSGASGGGFTVTGTYGSLSHSTSGSITLNFELEPTCYGTVTGTITDAHTGKPISGAAVNEIDESVATAADGSYTLTKLPLAINNGTTQITIQVDDAAYYRVNSAEITISCGTTSNYDASMQVLSYGNVVGHVYVGTPDPSDPTTGAPLPTSVPIPGANITLYDGVTGLEETAATAADGSYSLSNIALTNPEGPSPSGLSVSGPHPALAAYPLGFWGQSPGVRLTPGSTVTQDVSLVPVCTGTVTGTVYSEDSGLPLAGATVTDGLVDGISDANGNVEFTGVPLGLNNTPTEVALSAQNAEGTSVEVSTSPATLEACGDTSSASVYLHVPVKNVGNLAVTVLDATTGDPIGDALINSLCPLPAPVQQPAGTYTMANIEVGTDSVTSLACQVAASAAGYYNNVTQVTVYSGLTSIATIKLTPQQSSTITGTVTDAVTGKPITGILVLGGVSALTNAEGQYTLTGNNLLGANNASQADLITFESETEQYLESSATVTAVAGQTETLNMALAPQCGPATVSGTVYNASNQQPIADANVSAPGAGTTTDASGNWTLQVEVFQNKAFSAAFTATAAGFNPKTENIELFCGAHIQLNFGQNNTETGTLTGTVTNAANSAPVVGAFVGAGFGATTTTNASGVYTFNNVPLGNNNAAESWDVTVDPPAGSPLQPQIKTVSVPAAGATLNFALGSTPPPLPVAANYTESTPKDTPLILTAASGLLSSDSGTGIEVTSYQQASTKSGTVTATPAGAYTYDPPSYLNGADSFTYTITDEYGNNATGTVTITVGTPTPPPPVAADYTATTPFGTPLVVADAGGLLSKSTGTAITLTSHTQPSHGVLTVDGAGGYTYTPTSGYYGADSFTYLITDSAAQTSTGTVSLTVSPPAAPVAANYTATTAYNTALVVPVGTGLLSNDSGDTITVTAHSSPTHGAVTVAANGSYTYTPSSGYSGSDTFTYTITDALAGTATGTVSLTVSPPAAPVAASYSETTPYYTALVVAAGTGLLSNDSGDSITVTAHSTPTHGTLTVAANGSYTYTPASGYSGSDSFTYTITDALARTATGTVSLTVSPAPPAPVAANYTATTPYDTALVVPAGTGLLSHDSGDTITVTAHSTPTHGAVTVAANGSYTYTPSSGYSGSDSFTYTITDALARTATGTVSLTVSPPAAPVAASYSETTPYDTALVVAAGTGLLSNDTGDSITVTAHSTPTHGTLTTSANGSYTYTPSSGYSGSDSFSYTITDALNRTASGTVSLTVSPAVVTPTTMSAPPPVVAPPAATPSPRLVGYREIGADGGVFDFGADLFYGSIPGIFGIGNPVHDIVGITSTPDNKGYWLVRSNGGVYSFGDAKWFGSPPQSQVPTHQIVGISSTPDGKGYWLVGSDGGVFTYGDAQFYGSAATEGFVVHDVVGIASTPDGKGYWLVGADGGVFAFGDALYLGSVHGTGLGGPITQMSPTPDGNGYWLVGSDGGVFTFGDAPFFGSTGGQRLIAPVIGIAPTQSGSGYWLGQANGGRITFGDAPNEGTLQGVRLNAPMVSMGD